MEVRMTCPCMRYKYQIFRKQIIYNKHSHDYGVFLEEYVQKLHTAPHNIELVPTCTHSLPIKRPSQNPNLEQKFTPSTHKVAMEEIGMEEMLDAFFNMDTSTKTQNESNNVAKQQQTPTQPHQTIRPLESIDKKGEMMANLAQMLLYSGSKVSILQASLVMLNLQAVYG